MRHWFQSECASGRGNFREANDELLALFGDPDARGGRNWRQTFGYEPAPPSRAERGAYERARNAEIVV